MAVLVYICKAEAYHRSNSAAMYLLSIGFSEPQWYFDAKRNQQAPPHTTHHRRHAESKKDIQTTLPSI